MSTSDVTLVLVNYKTLQFTSEAVESFLVAYPRSQMVLVDNASNDASTRYLRKFAGPRKKVTLIVTETNLTHGPALHLALLQSKTPYTFTMDSDCEILKGGFLERMIQVLQQERVYATGRRMYFCRRPDGSVFSCRALKFGKKQYPGQELLPRVHPSAMLLKTELYRRFPPFIAAKEPELENMIGAINAGYKTVPFGLTAYIYHHGAGTMGSDGDWDSWIGD